MSCSKCPFSNVCTSVPYCDSSSCCISKPPPSFPYEFFYNVVDANGLTITNNALVPFTTEGIRSGFNAPTSGNTIFPISKDGYYEVTWQISAASTVTGGKVELSITIDGTTTGILAPPNLVNGVNTANTSGSPITGRAILKLTAGKTISIINTSGSSIIMNTPITGQLSVNGQLLIKQLA